MKLKELKVGMPVYCLNGWLGCVSESRVEAVAYDWAVVRHEDRAWLVGEGDVVYSAEEWHEDNS